MKTKLQEKAERLIRIDSRRRAHNAALSSLHASPLKPGEDHETRGLAMWRKLRRLEATTHDATTAQCNGEAYNGQPYRSYTRASREAPALSEWEYFLDSVTGKISVIFCTVPSGFFINGDARGPALKLRTARCNDRVDNVADSIPPGMVTDWGGYGILAAEIND